MSEDVRSVELPEFLDAVEFLLDRLDEAKKKQVEAESRLKELNDRLEAENAPYLETEGEPVAVEGKIVLESSLESDEEPVESSVVS